MRVAYAFLPFPAQCKPMCDATLPSPSLPNYNNNSLVFNPLLSCSSLPLTTIIHVNGIPYVVNRPLGEGLHSRVYSAYDRRTGQKVAIKIVENLDSKMINREHSKMFFREIRFLIKLQTTNPYVIRVFNHEFDYKTQTGKIVMECGFDFRFLLPLQVSSNEKKMSFSQAKFYWKQMAAAVALLHRHGIVHSDIKPENFVLTNDGKLKIIDLGLSFHLSDSQVSILRPFAGTPEYMPPEVCQLQNGQYSHQGRPSDIWALGVLLFEMIFGYRPFEHVRDNYEKMSHIARLTENPMVPPSDHPHLREIIQLCLQIDPTRRPTAEQLLQHQFFKC